MRKYNTQLRKIALPEYGRNVQGMIEYCKTINDRATRTRYAYTIVEIMADIFPDIKQVENKDRILWDHLALIANYELDIDYPYEIFRQNRKEDHPEPMPLSQSRIQLRIYGKILEGMVAEARQLPVAKERIALFNLCANQMKRRFHEVNKEADEDNEKILQDLVNYAGPEFAEEIRQIKLHSKKELQKNDQYDPASLVETKKKKKKKK